MLLALRATCLACAILLAATLSCRADDDIWSFASGEFYDGYLLAGVALPLLDGGDDGQTQELRTLDALVTTTLATVALKQITGVARPDAQPGDKRDSFPSGHTSASFAIATMQSHFHPDQAAYWYGGAALIGVSRVEKKRHHALDVLAGAALGYGVAQFELDSGRGLLIAPLVDPDGDGFGLQLRKSW